MHQVIFRASSRVVAALLLLLLLQGDDCWCYQYKVGDLDCWGLPPPSNPLLYSSWSRNHFFRLGDSLRKSNSFSCHHCCRCLRNLLQTPVSWSAVSSVLVPAEPGLGDAGDAAGVQQLQPGRPHTEDGRRQLPLQPDDPGELLLHQRRPRPLREEPEAGGRHPLAKQRDLLPARRRLPRPAGGVAVLPDRLRSCAGSGTQRQSGSGLYGHGILRLGRAAPRRGSPVTPTEMEWHFWSYAW
ncbi:hypothetical protein BHE74_00046779 [Ensete ventricosum]|uniref:Leucine-rich repeat-containing N-terminal plant-type domain-containing protein n=1 Tax=Ensete ventricosum TaxID=4639 RepID=A0A445M8K3_ENSVE|nr:hypothetical protein BHE74_00046779 [Ensete ventricosum]RZR70573.1 hypothetical protein BHM03_00000450 [Ensete ventricosum]